MEDARPLRKAPPVLFYKSTLSKGFGFCTPQLGSVCKVKILVDESNLVVGLIDNIKDIIIGDTIDEPIDRILEACVRTMKEAETCLIKFDYGCATGIPNDEKSLQLQLISYTRVPEIWEMSVEDRWQKACHHKQRGLDLFARRQFDNAFRHFGLTLKYIVSLELDILPEQKEMDVDGLKLSSYLNLAACQLKHKNYECVVKNATKALKMHPNDVKALYRRGAAYVQLQEYEKAQVDLSAAQKLEPNNQAVLKQIQELKIRVHKLNQYYADRMKKLFN